MNEIKNLINKNAKYYSSLGDPKKKNEDLCLNGRVFGVLDGATCLGDSCTPCGDDAYWYVNRMAELLEQSEKSTISEMMKDAIEVTSREYLEFPNADKIVSGPSSGCASGMIDGENLNLFLIGDCCAIVSYKNGDIEHIRLEELPVLDQGNLNLMERIAKEKNISKAEARWDEELKAGLLEVRLSQNTGKERSYWILSNSTEAVDHALLKTIKLSEVKSVAFMSDGASSSFDTYTGEVFNTPDEFIKYIEDGGSLEEIISKVREVEDNDPTCEKYTRFKKSDDASIYFLDVENLYSEYVNQ